MNLAKKKMLAAKTLGVGKDRIIFSKQHLAEIKESISKQDIRDLVHEKAIHVREIRGRRKVRRRTTRRRAGSIHKRIKKDKRHYIILTRKLRRYLVGLREKDKISREKYLTLRKHIRAGMFKDTAHFEEHL